MSTSITLEDFNLSPEDLKTLVEGSQQFLSPAVGDDNDSVDATPQVHTS
jgi:hypothetical protein